MFIISGFRICGLELRIWDAGFRMPEIKLGSFPVDHLPRGLTVQREAAQGQGLRFRVHSFWGLGARALGIRIHASVFKFQGSGISGCVVSLGFRTKSGMGFRFQGSESRVYRLGFRG